MFVHERNVVMGGRVSAGMLASMLASDGWTPKEKQKKPVAAQGRKKAAAVAGRVVKEKQRTQRKIVERDTMDALPAGHSVSWAALWGADKVPAFPGLVPMGGREVVLGVY